MKLTNTIHILRHDFEISLSQNQKVPRFVNSMVIFGKKITLIDTGIKGCADTIFKYIKTKGRDIADIETIILSHSHPDHIGSAARIKKITGCRVLAHENERNWIEDINNQRAMRPIPGFFELVNESVEVDGILKDGQVFKADDNISLIIIHSPGHSKGSINILFREDKILFTADSIPVKNDIPNYDNFNDLMKSLNCIKISQDYSFLLTSWTPPLTSQKEIKKLLDEGENYLKLLDETVKNYYIGKESDALKFCKKVISKLELPEFYVNPIVDEAFKGHKK